MPKKPNLMTSNVRLRLPKSGFPAADDAFFQHGCHFSSRKYRLPTDNTRSSVARHSLRCMKRTQSELAPQLQPEGDILLRLCETDGDGHETLKAAECLLERCGILGEAYNGLQHAFSATWKRRNRPAGSEKACVVGCFLTASALGKELQGYRYDRPASKMDTLMRAAHKMLGPGLHSHSTCHL